MPVPSAATATTATTAIRPTSSAYSTMEAPRSVRARLQQSELCTAPNCRQTLG